MTPKIIPDAESARQFMLAGRATVTLRSVETDRHITYRLEAPKRDLESGRPLSTIFALVLTAPDQYTYVGTMEAPDWSVRRTKKSRMDETAAPIVALRYAVSHILAGRIPSKLEIRHDGRCGRCRRQLTRPDSIDRGIGPECAEILGLV